MHGCCGTIACHSGEREATHNGGHLARDKRDVGRAAPAIELDGDGRPGRVGIRRMSVQTVKAWPDARFDDGADDDLTVAEHDGQVRDVAAKPESVKLGLDGELPDS